MDFETFRVSARYASGLIHLVKIAKHCAVVLRKKDMGPALEAGGEDLWTGVVGPEVGDVRSKGYGCEWPRLG